jgi:hypothetical protein
MKGSACEEECESDPKHCVCVCLLLQDLIQRCCVYYCST